MQTKESHSRVCLTTIAEKGLFNVGWILQPTYLLPLQTQPVHRKDAGIWLANRYYSTQELRGCALEYLLGWGRETKGLIAPTPCPINCNRMRVYPGTLSPTEARGIYCRLNMPRTFRSIRCQLDSALALGGNFDGGAFLPALARGGGWASQAQYSS